MKKYLFFILFAAAAIFLSGCNQDRTNTVVYYDEPSPLTRMSYSSTAPPDTYSEYMATYTPESEETSENGRYGSMMSAYGVYADTGVTAPFYDGTDSGQHNLWRDTAVTAPTTVSSEDGSGNTETSVPDMTDVSEETAVCTVSVSEPTETSSESGSDITAFRPAYPKADTSVSEKVSADTAPSLPESSDTRLSEKTKVSENKTTEQ